MDKSVTCQYAGTAVWTGAPGSESGAGTLALWAGGEPRSVGKVLRQATDPGRVEQPTAKGF